ncbi:hypothetical protein MCOR25_005792 [Pyricularia grisea]|nr:hypothetical protein MCOR25_005792 [Pyricularia grisea]
MTRRKTQPKNVATRNKKKPPSGLMDLPMEIITMIVHQIESTKDLSSFSMVNRAFLKTYELELFTATFESMVGAREYINVVLDLFFHAVRHDSVRIIGILVHHLTNIEIKGYMPAEPFETKRITYFHHALIADAPRVSAYLSADGDDMFDESFEFYPSMAAIYHGLFPQTVATQWDLNKALRVACNYGLSRTAYVLLNRGADPMDMSPFGMMPIHLALANSQPWWDSAKYEYTRIGFEVERIIHHLGWEELARWNISALLKFGCPVDLRSAQHRRHKCDHKCLGSLDCNHHEQTPLHMAAKINFRIVAEFLLDEGADPYTPNGEGYTPLYCAIVHESSKVAGVLFKRCQPNVNPVVHIPTGTTALHIACRFALPPMVDWLLEAGADPDVVNSRGMTPMHEVLCQTQPDRSQQVYLVLKSLARFNADPATPSSAPKTPWDMAKNHPFPDVQEMFADRTLMTFWELDQLSGGNTIPPRKGRRQRKRGNQGIKRTDKQAPWQTVATSSPTEPEVQLQLTEPGYWRRRYDSSDDRDPWAKEDRWCGTENRNDELKPWEPATVVPDNFLDFGEDLILFDAIPPIKPSPAASPQTQIASAGWRPKLLTLNNRPAKPKSNSSLFPEMERRDAAQKLANDDVSTSSQGIKKGQKKTRWNPIRF